ncbi:MAG: shikimate dehydrogenase [Proteobacteria bacterium]|nr:shikimate dehydrogenase [Pseudomonadota bacterium]MBU4296240.1 shikimate dehydrogenase [Pseudomonadota bacterium]MCG2746402.1 shikimate dehydrogenase [Desulfobulbaceae bacterium]
MQINGRTVIHGIMGNPVSHSLSPAMHNSAFAALDLNAAYVPFPVSDVAAAMAGFRALGIRGVSVTIPHKQAVIALLDNIDPVAAKIGAVNTLDIQHGRIIGHNTDWLGANRALAEKTALPGKKVLILGAGGSARAIGFGLLEAGAQIMLASRTAAKGIELAETLGCPWHALEEIADLAADCLVNATSVGMAPHTEASLVPQACLPRFTVVMDIVYAPQETKLLSEAKEAGCQVVNGLAMLLYQGVAQFELWTGRQAPIDIMRDSLLAALAAK